MKNKKGFTLIELLAVIVILAIIALIAVPIVLNIINNSRESATERSVENYLTAVEQSVAKELLDDTNTDYDGIYEISNNGKTLTNISDSTKVLSPSYSGTGIESGRITLTNGKVTGVINGKIDNLYVVINGGKIQLLEDLSLSGINLFDYKAEPLKDDRQYYQPLEILTENNSLILKANSGNAVQIIQYYIYVGSGNTVTITIPSISLGEGANFSNSKVSYEFSDTIEYLTSNQSTLFSFYNLSANTNYSVKKTFTATGDYLVFSPMIQKSSDYNTAILTMSNIQIEYGTEEN